jgi:glc operon protein GlcG
MPDRITLDAAQRAIAAAFDQAKKDGRNMAAAVVDASGDPICCARMDTTHERVLRFALRKAYTAAVMQRDTLAFKRDMERANRTLADYGDSMFTTLQGGLVVTDQGQVIGGIAVGGGTSEGDEAVARLALRTLGFDEPQT